MRKIKKGFIDTIIFKDEEEFSREMREKREEKTTHSKTKGQDSKNLF